jgi:hypothetical protein
LFSVFISSKASRAGVSCHAQVVDTARIFQFSSRIFCATLDTPLDLITPMAKRRKRLMFSGPWLLLDSIPYQGQFSVYTRLLSFES